MTRTLLCVLVVFVLMDSAARAQAPAKPVRINKVIDLWEQGQPVYYDTTSAGGYEMGKKFAHTTADYINYEMEHGSFDFTALREFMRGLADSGPTRSGHRTPAVIVTLPVLGLDEAGMRANHWVIHQTLAAGVHGILLCHARVPAAGRVMVETARYPFAPPAKGLDRGLRGSGSQGFASQIWGIPGTEYLRRADVWPLNKEGEILLGLKIEDSYALENAEASTRVPGIAFAEWGPGDMGFWLIGIPRARGTGAPVEQAPVLLQARARVLAATKAAGIRFLNACNAANVAQQLKDGVMICAGTGGAEIGRKMTKRQMPW